MLTYQLRERRVHFLSGVSPQFPADVALSVKLEPVVPFGGHAGETKNSVAGSTFKLRINPSTGKCYIKTDTPLFDKLDASATIDKIEFQIQGNIATIRTRCASLQELVDLLTTLHFAFPPILNIYLPDTPHSLYAWGTVGEEKFQWHFHPDGLRRGVTVTSKEHQEHLVVDSWRQVQHAVQSRRLIAALVYFHTACRLLNAGSSRFEFIAESLLNMAKCLQALFGEKRDAVVLNCGGSAITMRR